MLLADLADLDLYYWACCLHNVVYKLYGVGLSIQRRRSWEFRKSEDDKFETGVAPMQPQEYGVPGSTHEKRFFNFHAQVCVLLRF